eukprot:3918970-Rhodomonas_salina.2
MQCAAVTQRIAGGGGEGREREGRESRERARGSPPPISLRPPYALPTPYTIPTICPRVYSTDF